LAGPLGLLGRAMLAYIFIVEGAEKIANYFGVVGYMQANGVDGLIGFKKRWAGIALFGFCLLTALFFHLGADQTIEMQKNIAMAGGFLTLAIYGPDA
jgi:putative oxidoreductase